MTNLAVGCQDTQVSKKFMERPGFLIRRLHLIYTAQFLEECGENKITAVQYAILCALSEVKNTSQIVLAEELGIDRTNIADVLARIEKRAFVKRIENSKDRREKLVSITAKGRNMIRKLEHSMRRSEERLLDPINPQKRDQFVSLLHQIVVAHNSSGRSSQTGGAPSQR